MKMKKARMSARRRVCGYVGILLLSTVGMTVCGGPTEGTAADENAGTGLHGVYAEDDRLEFVGHETYEWNKEEASSGNGAYNAYTLVTKVFDEEEKAEVTHAYFDENDRLLYVLGYSANILGGGTNYCEENVYQRNDAENTCRYIYYKSNSIPYGDGYCVAYRYMFEVSDHQFDEEGRLCRTLTYRRDVGLDPNGYSEELFFSRGYEAEYDGAYLTAELQYYDYWGTNEVGAWEYGIYQYDEQGNCILRVTTTEDEITLCCYEYHKDAGQMDEYTYQVTEDWELSCEDGSAYYFSPQWGEKPAIQKTAADGSVERELFYGKAMDLGQRHYLTPEEVEETVDDHKYIVRPGDCLWDIAYRSYGRGSYYDLLYRLNRETIGPDENLLVPGTRLFVPEAGNPQDTKVSD